MVSENPYYGVSLPMKLIFNSVHDFVMFSPYMQVLPVMYEKRRILISGHSLYLKNTLPTLKYFKMPKCRQFFLFVFEVLAGNSNQVVTMNGTYLMRSRYKTPALAFPSRVPLSNMLPKSPLTLQFLKLLLGLTATSHDKRGIVNG